MINVDQFTACVLVLPRRGSDKIFDGLLFAVWKLQEGPVGRQPPVDIDPLKVVKIEMNIVLLHFVLQVGDVKLIAVKMDQIAVWPGKCDKCIQYIGLIFIVGRKPLYGLPAGGLVRTPVKIGASDQIETGAAHIQSGGLYIDKQCLVWNTEVFDRVFRR